MTIAEGVGANVRTFPWGFWVSPSAQLGSRGCSGSLVLVWGCWGESAPLPSSLWCWHILLGLLGASLPLWGLGEHGEQQMLPGKPRLSPEPSRGVGDAICPAQPHKLQQQLPHTRCESQTGSRVTRGVLGMFSPPLSLLLL